VSKIERAAADDGITEEKQVTPYTLESFKYLMNQIVDNFVASKSNQSTEVCIATNIRHVMI
jgi:hypothetical protein